MPAQSGSALRAAVSAYCQPAAGAWTCERYGRSLGATFTDGKLLFQIRILMSECSPIIGESPEALQQDRRRATVRRLRLQSLEHDLAFQRVLDLLVSQLAPSGAGISISTPRVAMIKAGFNFRLGDHDPDGSIIDWPLRLGRPLMVSDAAADPHAGHGH